MYNIGDLVIYSSHGICHIDEICEKTYLNVTKSYYVLHPLGNSKLEINIPVDSDKITMKDLPDRAEAEELLDSFRYEGISWVDIKSQRAAIYYDIAKSGDRKQISRIANTLMRKKEKRKLKAKPSAIRITGF
jgi:CarD family transcriptional regulator